MKIWKTTSVKISLSYKILSLFLMQFQRFKQQIIFIMVLKTKTMQRAHHWYIVDRQSVSVW